METLQNELNELKNFIADLKADRAAQKEKERREAWTKYTSLSIVFIAVLAAVATQWSGKYSSRVLVALNDATFHQAKATFLPARPEHEVIDEELALAAEQVAECHFAVRPGEKVFLFDFDPGQLATLKVQLI